MENIHENLKEELKNAMKAKDKVRVSVLRDFIAAFINEAVASGKTAQSILDDEEAMKVIQRKAKQRKDSIESFEKGGRDDLVQKEKAELEIIEEYLPEQLSDEELEKIVDEVIEETGAEGAGDMGKVMGKAMEKVGVRAEGGQVAGIVKRKLSEPKN